MPTDTVTRDPDPERICLNPSMWIVYERDADSDDSWSFCDAIHIDDPGSAARQICAAKWAGGRHLMLAVGLRGAFEYEVTLGTKGPVV